MSDRTCSIDGCARPVKSRGWCQAHYFRWRRNGDPGGPVLMLKGQPKQPCHIDGCERDVNSLGLCDPHYQRYRKWGDPYYIEERNPSGPDNPQWKYHDIGYTTAHDRVRALHGSASHHQCCNCGRSAKHWAYDHDDPDERGSEFGPYSVDPSHYLPMCVSCHKRFDLDRTA